MVDYSKKFRLDNKIAFVFGGVGLIGSEVSMALASVGAKTIILDVDEKRFKALSHGLSDRKFDVYFHNFDVTDINFLEVNLQELIDQYGTPDIFINCSYPRTSDWIKNTFSEASYNSYSNNIKIHLNSTYIHILVIYIYTISFICLIILKITIARRTANFKYLKIPSFI